MLFSPVTLSTIDDDLAVTALGRPDPDADEAFLPLLEEEGESEREGSK